MTGAGIYREECREVRGKNHVLVVDVIGRYAVRTCNKRRFTVLRLCSV